MPTKQAHYVPQTYLRGFLFDEKKERTYAYNSRSGLITPAKIGTICSQNYLYRVEVEDGVDSDEIEEALANDIEPKYSDWLRAVRAGGWLENSTIADIAVYIVLQHLRVPGSLNFLKVSGDSMAKEFAKEELQKILDDTTGSLLDDFRNGDPEGYGKVIADNPDFDEEALRKTIRDVIDGSGAELTADVGKNHAIIAVFEHLLPLADLFMRRGWYIMRAPVGHEFITGDMPAFVAKRLPGGVVHFEFGGFGRTDVDIIFPMARDVCVVISGPEYLQKNGVVSAAAVNEINRIVASRPNIQYLISSKKELVERYSKGCTVSA